MEVKINIEDREGILTNQNKAYAVYKASQFFNLEPFPEDSDFPVILPGFTVRQIPHIAKVSKNKKGYKISIRKAFLSPSEVLDSIGANTSRMLSKNVEKSKD